MASDPKRLRVVVGEPGMGKTWATLREQSRGPLGDVDLVVYHSPNDDDVAPAPFVRMTPAQLERGASVPRRLQLVRCSALEAIRIVERMLARWRVRLVLDEAHQVVPNYGQTWIDPYSEDERAELRRWSLRLLRSGRHHPLWVVLLSSSITGLHPEVWRFAGTTVYFRQKEKPDLVAIEVRHGARAAYQVSLLPEHEYIVCDRADPPLGWTGYSGELARKVGRNG